MLKLHWVTAAEYFLMSQHSIIMHGVSSFSPTTYLLHTIGFCKLPLPTAGSMIFMFNPPATGPMITCK